MSKASRKYKVGCKEDNRMVIIKNRSIVYFSGSIQQLRELMEDLNGNDN